MAVEAWLDVLRTQGLVEEGVGHEVDLADGEVVGRLPMGIEGGDFGGVQIGAGVLGGGHAGSSVRAQGSWGWCEDGKKAVRGWYEGATRAGRRSVGADRGAWWRTAGSW